MAIFLKIKKPPQKPKKKRNSCQQNYIRKNCMQWVPIKIHLGIYCMRMQILGYSTFLRIELGKRFLGRLCQNEFMQSNNFHLQPHVSNCNEVEARANNYENKGSLCTYFKNSFAWLTGMKKLIFDYSNFFGSGHFSIHQI